MQVYICHKNKTVEERKLEQICICLLIQKYTKSPFLDQLYTIVYKWFEVRNK